MNVADKILLPFCPFLCLCLSLQASWSACPLAGTGLHTKRLQELIKSLSWRYVFWKFDQWESILCTPCHLVARGGLLLLVRFCCPSCFSISQAFQEGVLDGHPELLCPSPGHRPPSPSPAVLLSRSRHWTFLSAAWPRPDLRLFPPTWDPALQLTDPHWRKVVGMGRRKKRWHDTDFSKSSNLLKA